MNEQADTLINNARLFVQKQLELISKLDQQFQMKSYRSSSLKNGFIQRLQHKEVEFIKEGPDRNTELIDEITTLDEEIEQLAEQKVRLANSLYCHISGCCEEAEDLLISLPVGSEQESGKQTGDSDFESTNLIAMCKIQENQDCCICSLQHKMSMGEHETMILCEGKACPRRWYHIKCVNIQQSTIPECWTCDLCKLGLVLSKSDQTSEQKH